MASPDVDDLRPNAVCYDSGGAMNGALIKAIQQHPENRHVKRLLRTGVQHCILLKARVPADVHCHYKSEANDYQDGGQFNHIEYLVDIEPIEKGFRGWANAQVPKMKSSNCPTTGEFSWLRHQERFIKNTWKGNYEQWPFHIYLDGRQLRNDPQNAHMYQAFVFFLSWSVASRPGHMGVASQTGRHVEGGVLCSQSRYRYFQKTIEMFVSLFFNYLFWDFGLPFSFFENPQTQSFHFFVFGIMNF